MENPVEGVEKRRAGPPSPSLFRRWETEISTFNSRLMCVARLDLFFSLSLFLFLSFFFHVLPLLTPGGIINPPPKTACRDQAAFFEGTRWKFQLVCTSPLFFFPFPISLPSFFLFLFFTTFNRTRMYTDIKLSIRERLRERFFSFARNLSFFFILTYPLLDSSRRILLKRLRGGVILYI